MEEYHLAERTVCELIAISRSSLRYRQRQDRHNLPLRDAIGQVAKERTRAGYRQIADRLRRAGWKVNHKRVWRQYKLLGLNLRVKPRRRLR